MRGVSVLGRLSAVVLLGVVASCRSLRPDRGDPAEGIVPGGFSEAGEVVQRPACWWAELDSPELAELMQEAFARNLTLAQAEARLRQAEARAIKAGAERRPSASLAAGAGRTRRRGGTSAAGGQGSSGTRTTEAYSLGVSFSYALDFWGEARAGKRAALRTAEAAEEDVRAAALLLSGNVAEYWLKLVEQRCQLALASEQLETNRTTLDLLQLRRRKGQSTALAVLQQKQVVAATEAVIPQIEAQVSVLEHGLAVLLGRPATHDLGLHTHKLPDLPSLPEPGLPAGLLGRRPDIRAALRRLEAADWDVAEAKADRLPSISLSGQAGYESAALSDLLDSWFLKLAGDLLAPLVDGGSRKAEAARAKAAADELLGAYRELVLTAVQEVEDALVQETKRKEALAALERELVFARNARDEARTRYRKGASDYLTVLTALVSLQRLEREVLTARRELLSNRVGLYLAVGGGTGDEEAKERRDQEAGKGMPGANEQRE